MKRIIIAASLILVVSSVYVLSFSSYLRTFNTLYGTADTRLDQCITCHMPGEPYSVRNPYGQDVEIKLNQLGDITAALQAVEALDSDGDGDTNIAEINARTFPGEVGSTTPVEQTTWGALKHFYK